MLKYWNLFMLLDLENWMTSERVGEKGTEMSDCIIPTEEEGPLLFPGREKGTSGYEAILHTVPRTLVEKDYIVEKR